MIDIHKYGFTLEQVAERERFAKDLKDGKAEIAFTGTRSEAIAFLHGIRQACGILA